MCVPFCVCRARLMKDCITDAASGLKKEVKRILVIVLVTVNSDVPNTVAMPEQNINHAFLCM